MNKGRTVGLVSVLVFVGGVAAGGWLAASEPVVAFRN